MLAGLRKTIRELMQLHTDADTDTDTETDTDIAGAVVARLRSEP